MLSIMRMLCMLPRHRNRRLALEAAIPKLAAWAAQQWPPGAQAGRCSFTQQRIPAACTGFPGLKHRPERSITGCTAAPARLRSRALEQRTPRTAGHSSTHALSYNQWYLQRQWTRVHAWRTSRCISIENCLLAGPDAVSRGELACPAVAVQPG